MLGSHGQGLKRKPWEESIRVPASGRFPAQVKAGRKVDALLSHVDFAPTLLSLCGSRRCRACKGRSLGRGPRQSELGPDSAFFQIFVPFAGDGTPHPWRGVRTARHMYAQPRRAVGAL